MGIAAAIIGGTSLSGDRGRVFGALVGALLMVGLNGMSLMNLPTFYRAARFVILLAVAIDELGRRRAVSG